MIYNFFKTFFKKLLVFKQTQEINSFLKQLQLDPLNSELHLKYAILCLKTNVFLSFAEFKTAHFLGLDTEAEQKETAKNTPPLIYLSHNQYFRFKSLADEIHKLKNGIDKFSVLDVGGGSGLLAQFIPEAHYCLADPATNGISGVNLPFKDKSFDIVVACHVLEHIPMENRDFFIDALIAKSKKYVILLNPFEIEELPAQQRLQLFIDITNAGWAKEHLEYTLPKLDLIHAYARKHHLNYYIKENGTLATTMAIEFCQHFANMSGKKSDMEKINSFFNKSLYGQLNSIQSPVAHLIVFDLT